MTDQTGAEQQSAAGSRTGDVDVADQNRPDTTTDVQTGGATDLGAGGPDAGTTEDDAAIRGGEDADAPRGERDDTDQESRDDAEARTRPARSGTATSRFGRRGLETRTRTLGTRRRTVRRRTRSARRRPRSSPASTTRSSTTSRPARSSGRRATGPRTRPAARRCGTPRAISSRAPLRASPTRARVPATRIRVPPNPIQDGSESSSADDGPRTSSLDEIRDGGYGVGSAATIDDGAVPLGHPVKAWEDTKTFVTPDHAKYDEAEPHLWFADEHAAQRAGFRPVD